MPKIIDPSNGPRAWITRASVILGLLVGIAVSWSFNASLPLSWVISLVGMAAGFGITKLVFAIKDMAAHRAEEQDNKDTRTEFEKQYGDALKSFSGEVLEVNYRNIVLTFPSIAQRHAFQDSPDIPDHFGGRRVCFRM